MLANRQLIVASLLVLFSMVVAFLLGGRHFGDDAIVLIVFVLLTGGGMRSGMGLLSILAFDLTFPPYHWPLWWVCFVPLVWLWRESKLTSDDWLKEAFGVGFAMCWLSSPFVRSEFPRLGVPVHALASSLFGLQFIGIAAALRWSRNRQVLVFAPLVALSSTILEILRVYVLRWPLLAIGFPAANTPLAQWAYYLSPFGVSFIIYTVNFLCLPRGASWLNLRAWLAPLTAAGFFALAWYGGELIAKGVRVEPVPLSALLVQPNRVVGGSVGDARPKDDGSVAHQLERQTRATLDGSLRVDLVVWPECSISRADEGHPPLEQAGEHAETEEPTLQWLLQYLVSDMRVPFLVGAIARSSDGHLFNSAFLITPQREIQRYDKRILVIGSENKYTPGGQYRCLLLRTTGERTVRLGISICYEMHFPGLPQYRAANRPDVLVHLNNESMYRHYAGQQGHGTWACQYRAIETRAWQFVCASWTRTAVIDPRGCVRAILGPRPDTLWVAPESDSGRGDPDLHAAAQ